jgi:NADH-dependent peroxiredoxin subunit F
LFSDKEVMVVSKKNSALDAALQLVRIAKQVYLVNISAKLTGDAVMREKLSKYQNIEILNKSKVAEITGDKFVQAVKVEIKGVGGVSERLFPVQGVFIEAGLVPNSGFIDFVDKNERDEIEIDCGSSTSVAGIFAAGDVTDVPDKQIVIAAGDGAKAALAAFRYLSTH